MDKIADAIISLAQELSKPSISDWMMVGITIIYVLATCMICYFNFKSAKAASMQLEEAKKGLEESRKQQRQNAGIQLYSIRKDFISSFSEKEYNKVYWDAPILFSEKAANEVQKTAFAYEKYCKACNSLQNYTDRMKEDRPEMYDEYCRLSSLCGDNDASELDELCKGYTPVFEEIDGEKRLLVYSDIMTNLRESNTTHGALHLRTFMLLKDELQESIALK